MPTEALVVVIMVRAITTPTVGRERPREAKALLLCWRYERAAGAAHGEAGSGYHWGAGSCHKDLLNDNLLFKNNEII